MSLLTSEGLSCLADILIPELHEFPLPVWGIDRLFVYLFIYGFFFLFFFVGGGVVLNLTNETQGVCLCRICFLWRLDRTLSGSDKVNAFKCFYSFRAHSQKIFWEPFFCETVGYTYFCIFGELKTFLCISCQKNRKTNMYLSNTERSQLAILRGFTRIEKPACTH